MFKKKISYEKQSAKYQYQVSVRNAKIVITIMKLCFLMYKMLTVKNVNSSEALPNWSRLTQ